MQIWRTSRPALVYLREIEASEASRVLLWLRVLAIESIDIVCFELLLGWSPPRDFTLTGTTFTFQKIFSQRKLRIHAIRRGDGKHFTAKVQVQVQVQVVASLALEEMTHESIWMKEFSQEMVLFHDACIVCYLSNKR